MALAFATEIKNDSLINDLKNKGASSLVVNNLRLAKEICQAVEDGDSQKVIDLVAEGANVNVIYESPKYANFIAPILVASIRLGNNAKLSEQSNVSVEYEKIAIELIKNGANVNGGTYDNWTPLMEASQRDNLELVKLLLEKGADVNAQSYKNGNTALYEASQSSVYYNTTKVAKELVANGADVNTIYKHHLGTTVLHLASKYGNLELVRTYIARGANVNIKDDDGKTALDWAKHPKIPKYSCGSKEDYKGIIIILEPLTQE